MVARCFFPEEVQKLVRIKVFEYSTSSKAPLISKRNTEIPGQIVRAMGGVPLAIEQARAVINQGVPLRDLLAHFKTHYQTIMARKPVRSAWDYEKNMSIISIFNMIFRRLGSDSDAKNVLAFASCFGPRPIPVQVMGQLYGPEAIAVSSIFGRLDVQHTPEIAWLIRFVHDPLAFQLAIGHLESVCLIQTKQNSEGSVISISLHDSVRRWRFETLTGDMKEGWIIAACYALKKSLPKINVDPKYQLPLFRHFYHLIPRYIEPQKLEAPDGKLYRYYGLFMTHFAHLYLNSGYRGEGEYVFLKAIEYQKILEGSSWPKDRPSLLLLKGQAMMFSENGKMEDAAETTKTLHDASMKICGPGDEITSWAAARLPVARDDNNPNVQGEQSGVIAPRGPKLNSDTLRRRSDEPDHTRQGILQSRPQEKSTSHVAEGKLVALTVAAWNGNLEDVRQQLNRGADINRHDTNSITALSGASWNGYGAVAKLLLDRGAEVNAKGGLFGTALHAASRRGRTAVVEMLLRHGADVNTESDYHGTAVQDAALNGHADSVQLLLIHGADTRADGGYGTALQLAAFGGHLGVVRLLLDHGVDVHAVGCRYGTALQAAARQGHTAVVDLLVAAGARGGDDAEGRNVREF